MRRIIATAALAVAGLWLSAAASPAAERVSFTPGWFFYGRDVGFFASIEKGYYTREGIDFIIEPGKGAADAMNRVAGKRNRFAVAGNGAVVITRSKGVPVKVISMYHDKPLDVIYTLKGSGITKPKDLEGKKLGASPKDAAAMLFPALAKTNKIETEKVNWIYMNPTSKIPSLLAARVDAIVIFHNSYPAATAAAAKSGKEIVPLLYADWGLDIYSAGIIALEEDLKQNGDLVRRFLKATYEGTAWAIDHPDEAVKLFLKHNTSLNPKMVKGEWLITAEHLLTPLARKNGLGYMDRNKMERTIQVVADSMGEKPVPVDEFYTSRFLPKIFPESAKR